MRHTVFVRAASGAIALAALVAGCATATNEAARQSELAFYRMPTAEIQVQVTYQLTSCPTPQELRTTAPPVGVNIVAVTSANAGVDSGGPFAIRRTHVSSARTSGEATIAFNANRTLRSINMKSEDRTGQIITNVIGAISSIARIASMGPSSANAVAPDPCTAPARTALTQRDRIDARIRALEGAVIDARQVNATLLAATRAEIEALRADRAALISRSLSFSRTFHFTPQPGQLAQTFDANLASTFITTATARDVASRFAIGVLVAPMEPVLAPSDRPTPTESQLVLREPVYSRLFVCRRACSMDAATGRPDNALQSLDVMVPQLGAFRTIDLRAGYFQTRAMELTFGPFGDVEAAKITGNAQAEQASAQLAAAFERVRTARDEIDADRATRSTAEVTRETALTNAQADLLAARRRLEEEIAKTAGE